MAALPRYVNQTICFREASQKVVKDALERIQKASPVNKVDARNLFFDLFKFFSDQRARIAKEIGAPHFDDFGRRRDTMGVHPQYYTYLGLKPLMPSEGYLSCGDRVKQLICTYLPELMKENKLRRLGDSLEDPSKPFPCQIRIRTFSMPKLDEVQSILKKICKFHIPLLKEGATENERKALAKAAAEFRDRFSQLPPDEQQLATDFSNGMAYLEESKLLPEDCSRFVCVELLWKIKGKPICATRYLCPYDPSLSPEKAMEALKENPTYLEPKTLAALPPEDAIIELMTSPEAVIEASNQLMRNQCTVDQIKETPPLLVALAATVVAALRNNSNCINFPDRKFVLNRSCVLINHMDREHIQDSLDEIADLFARIVLKENKESLKEALAEFQYRFAHTDPLERGSAAMGEWYLSALCAQRGITNQLSEEANQGDLEAFGRPYYPYFQKRFFKILKLDPEKQTIGDSKENI